MMCDVAKKALAYLGLADIYISISKELYNDLLKVFPKAIVEQVNNPVDEKRCVRQCVTRRLDSNDRHRIYSIGDDDNVYVDSMKNLVKNYRWNLGNIGLGARIICGK